MKLYLTHLNLDNYLSEENQLNLIEILMSSLSVEIWISGVYMCK